MGVKRVEIDSEGNYIVNGQVVRVRATKVGPQGQATTITRERQRDRRARNKANRQPRWNNEPTWGSTTFAPRESIVEVEAEQENNPEGRRQTGDFEDPVEGMDVK
jgi:hypothetical protein